jgi:diguanylate cyclase (GGDEF)-like protein
MRVLLIEDDEIVTQVLVKAFAERHYTVDVATDGQTGWELADACTYDLILLDVMLPKLNGISLCRQLRSQGLRTPILLLTAQDTITNKVMGLDAGADDYVTKPFEVDELLARMRALLRRGNSALPTILKWEKLYLNPSTCEVVYGDRPLHLTPKEYSLLELFLRNSQRVFSRSAILDHIWSFEEVPGEETVTAHIKGLRMKLKTAGLAKDPIETVYGIGYRLKSVEQPPKRAKKSKPLSQKLEQQAKEATDEIWQRLKEKFLSRVAVIKQATTAMLANNLDEELRQLAIAEAHKLVGTLGMFDLDEGSRLAREIEYLFESKQPLNPSQKEHLVEAIAAIQQELERTIAQRSLELLGNDERPVILIVEGDRVLAQDLATEVASRGMHAQVMTDLATARDWLYKKRPDAVLLDLSWATLEDNLTWLRELSAYSPPVPVLVLTERDNFLDRVQVARLGGRGFLQKPVSAPQVIEAIAQFLDRSRTNESRVMVVDDDPQILKSLRKLLEPWGIKLATVDNPLRFWEILESTSPDLLILDVQIPQISGIELCQVVRNDPRWATLPVLFLTARTDVKTMHRVFEVGADDYVMKPIVEPELLTRILNRLERSRLLRNLTEIDALTGVANRRKFTQELSQFFRFAQRHQQPLCFAIVDVDKLREINLHYGHAVGDKVLSRLGELLRKTFQSEDAIARWGGAEFVVAMYGMTKRDGVQRLSELSEILTQETFQASNNEQFQVSFTVGVVQYPEEGSDLQELYRAAHDLCLQAKVAIGRRVGDRV